MNHTNPKNKIVFTATVIILSLFIFQVNEKSDECLGNPQDQQDSQDITSPPNKSKISELPPARSSETIDKIPLPLGLGRETKEKTLARIESLNRTTAVFFCNNDVTDADLDRLINNKFIDQITFVNCPNLTGKCIERLSTLPNLTFLTFENCVKIEQADFALLKKAKKLHALRLVDCVNITDESIATIAKLGKLNTLELIGCSKVTPEGVSALGSLQMHIFSPPEGVLNDNDIECLTQFKSLVFLHLGFTDRYRRNLKRKGETDEDLKRRILPLTDEGIKKLRPMRRLEYMQIACCPQVTKEGIWSLRGPYEGILQVYYYELGDPEAKLIVAYESPKK